MFHLTHKIDNTGMSDLNISRYVPSASRHANKVTELFKYILFQYPKELSTLKLHLTTLKTSKNAQSRMILGK